MTFSKTWHTIRLSKNTLISPCCAYFDAKLPLRTQNDLNKAIVKDNEMSCSRFNTLLQPTS